MGTVFLQVLDHDDLLSAMRVSALPAAVMFLLALAVSFLLPRRARLGAALH